MLRVGLPQVYEPRTMGILVNKTSGTALSGILDRHRGFVSRHV